MFEKLITSFRLNEPSSYAALANLAILGGIALPEAVVSGIAYTLAGIFSIAAWAIKENGGK